MKDKILRVGFAGTPELAAVILSAILDQDFCRPEIVFTQPDRPAGRGQKILSSPVKKLATQNHLIISQPESPSALNTENILSSLDILVVVAFGMILPESVLVKPGYGCINVHTSLLPRWRGAAPIQRAIQSGDNETGVTVIQMDKGLDTGPVLGQKKCKIAENETSGSLHEKLADLGAICLIEVLEKVVDGKLTPVTQDNKQATYARKISKSEARIDWSKPATEIERMIRAFNPSPVACTEFNGKSFRIWESCVIDIPTNSRPGYIVRYTDEGIDIATGDKILRLLKIQPPGKKVMTTREFRNGKPDFFKNYIS